MKEEILTSQVFHQWKQNDCTVALLKLIEESVKIGREEILRRVENVSEINIEYLNFLKGKIHSFVEIQESIQNKQILESFIEVENVGME